MANDNYILIVDDSPLERRLLRGILEKSGYVVEEAESGRAAILSIERAVPDVVLLDIMMDQEDGIEVCRSLRENYSITELPILMVTSHSVESKLAESLEVGANDFISKPVYKAELLARVNTQLQIRRSTNMLIKTQEQLASKQRMESIGLLARAIAHNFNNTLGTIQGSAELLEYMIKAQGRERDIFNLISDAIKKAAKLTAGLYIFSTPKEEGLCESPAEVIKASLPLAEALSGSRIKYELQVDENLPPVAMTTADMSTVLLQLLKNSVTAISKEGLIAITAKRKEAAKVSFVVSDTGCGIVKEKVARIFDPFFSTKDSTIQDEMEMAFDGSGLGLYVAYNLVKQAGGSMQVLSSSREGTSIEYQVPVVQQVNLH